MKVCGVGAIGYEEVEQDPRRHAHASHGKTVAILRVLVDVYQEDFRTEKEGRKELASELEALRKEL